MANRVPRKASLNILTGISDFSWEYQNHRQVLLLLVGYLSPGLAFAIGGNLGGEVLSPQIRSEH
mgnify:CR=1 FL=1